MRSRFKVERNFPDEVERGTWNIKPGIEPGRAQCGRAANEMKQRKSESTTMIFEPPTSFLPRAAGETFYEGSQVGSFFHAAWRIFCRAILAKW